MCGISGVLDFSGRPIEESLLRAMTGQLVHRGPDAEGLWHGGPVALGHRRLSIRDLSEAGRQPMSDPSGRVTVSYNGEIYNEAELRRELERDAGVHFRSQCDTELIPAGYRAWGERIFDRLEGMFAIALWDADAECLFLARDSMGIKPLYVGRSGTRWRFASEAKAILVDPEQPRTLDPEALHAYLAQGYVAPDRTLLTEIEQLPPGTVRRIDRQGIKERRLWQPHRQPDIRRLDEAVDAFFEAWRGVLERIVVSDVPLGILQSGGIDSSLVTLGLRERSELPLFIASFDERSHDESELAEQVASAAGRPARIVPVAVEDVAETFRRMVRHYDGQLADSSGLAVYALCREVRRHTRVVLSGDGADELFGGYPTYRASRLAEIVRRVVPRSLLEKMGRLSWDLNAGRTDRQPAAELVARFLLGSATTSGAPHAEWRRYLMRHHMATLYGPELAPWAEAASPLARYAEAVTAGQGGRIDRCLLADQRHYLPADMLMKVDAMSMAHGLEVRLPFLERPVVEVAGRIHSDLLSPLWGPPKKVLRHALGAVGGPRAVVEGPKRGFNVPIAGLLRGPLAPLASQLLDDEVDRLAPHLDPGNVRRMWQSHRDGRANESYALWTLLSLATWREELDRPALVHA